MKKEYTLRYNWWLAIFEVETENLQPMKESLESFEVVDDCLIDSHGDIAAAFIEYFGKDIITASMSQSVVGIQRLFNEREDLIPIDGSMGIKLIQVDMWEFTKEDFSSYLAS